MTSYQATFLLCSEVLIHDCKNVWTGVKAAEDGWRIELHYAPSLSPSQSAVSRRTTEDRLGPCPPGNQRLLTHALKKERV
ncbi:hypothetical protein JOB18_032667 [Solea senegalensis]|uniref:Uncharacterized protein n=1 Tax=Solea senegalensis TaxID=28829 RepID=A0AAV6QVT1_SOLSE|nr:hypothetical protein JOB18_032667 [Solea senegalensis]